MKTTPTYPFVSYKGHSVSHNSFDVKTALGSTEMTVSLPWMQAASPQPLVDANQLTSLSAMIVYIAAQSGQSEFRIERSLSDRFGIPNAKCLPAGQFESALRYLVETLSN